MLLACVSMGCAATKTPLRPSDPIFAAAERNLRESASLVTTPRKVEPDEALFLQAESFYFYRFELVRSRSAGAYFAQAAAASTDFVPLNLLATSQGTFELRLRAYDGAAQLYQTIVDRYPVSRLRPLSLYRLGWACRSTTGEGFACSPEDSFAKLDREYPGSPEATLAREAVRVPYKSLEKATLWSILPGAGQIYCGETLNGVVRLSVAAGFGALALVPIVTMVQERKFGWLPTALSLVGIVGLQVTYTTSYQDAERAVLEYNERQEAGFAARHPPLGAEGAPAD